MTMSLIETKTLGSAASSIEFASISQSFTDLLFLITVRSSTTGTSFEPCLVTFNGNTTNYTARDRNGLATTDTNTSATYTSRFAFKAPRAGTTANNFCAASFYVPNYTSSNNKSFSVDSVEPNNASTERHTTIIAGRWENTSAITSVSFGPTANNFVAGTTISLYGILKGSDGITTAS